MLPRMKLTRIDRFPFPSPYTYFMTYMHLTMYILADTLTADWLRFL